MFYIKDYRAELDTTVETYGGQSHLTHASSEQDVAGRGAGWWTEGIDGPLSRTNANLSQDKWVNTLA